MDVYIKPEKSKKFEISVLVRDHFGNPTGQKKLHSTDSAEDLYSFWSRNNGHIKKKRVTKAATQEQSEKALKEATSYADDLQQKRDNITEETQV